MFDYIFGPINPKSLYLGRYPSATLNKLDIKYIGHSLIIVRNEWAGLHNKCDRKQTVTSMDWVWGSSPGLATCFHSLPFIQVWQLSVTCECMYGSTEEPPKEQCI